MYIFFSRLFFSLKFKIAPKYDTAYACEEKTLTIGCEPGFVINLIRANYGRFSITICNDQGNVDWSVNCMSAKSLRVLYAKCSHKQNCSILASTNTFGDPCPGTHKYLEAHYQCVSGKDMWFAIILISLSIDFVRAYRTDSLIPFGFCASFCAYPTHSLSLP